MTDFEQQVVADLATLKQSTKDLPELIKRVDSLESDRDSIKGLAYFGAISGVATFFIAIGRAVGRYIIGK